MSLDTSRTEQHQDRTKNFLSPVRAPLRARLGQSGCFYSSLKFWWFPQDKMLSCPLVPLCAPGVSLFWQPLAAVPTTSPCSGVGSVLAQGVKAGEQLPAGEGKERSFLERGAKNGFHWEKKKIIFLLTFSIASMAFSGENLNTTIFKPKYEVFNFGSIGQVWAAQFLTVKQHIFALFFFFFFYRMLTFSDSFSFKCCFTEHFQ